MTSKLTRERLEALANAEYCKSNPGAWLLGLKEVNELARMALAAMNGEPVAYIFKHPAGRLFWALTDESNKGQSDVMPVYAAPQPAVESDFIPKNLDKALGVLGMAIPESREEFNFQTERWIQRLIDRVIRYADEFQGQPAPVVPKEWAVADAVKFCKETGRQDAGAAMDSWNACRAAMLNGGKS